MKLCIDNRERDRIPLFENYIKAGKTKFIDGIVTGNYQTSDIHSPDGLVGIEYKKDDFVTSIFNEQLDKQLKELKDNFQYPYLFIGYNSIIDTISNNIGTNPDVIIGAICSVLSRHKVTVMFVGDFLVPVTIGVIERFYDGKTPVKLSSYTPIRRKPTSKEIKHAMMEKIPNFGAKKVNSLFENGFDIILINKETQQRASLEELMQIKGIGGKLANQIKEVLS